MMDLILPAGNLPSLKAAVEHGASAVYIGFRDDTNARHFGGLNFTGSQAARGIAHAHDRGVRVLAAVNTYAQADGWSRWTHAVDRAADLGVDALILADIGLMDYARERHPDLRLHLLFRGPCALPTAQAGVEPLKVVHVGHGHDLARAEADL